MPEAATALASLIATMPNLKHVDASDCISGIETSLAMQTLNILATSLVSKGLDTLLLNDNALGSVKL